MGWWQDFYKWLGTDQSGNLAEWAGGVGTVGALLFGFAQLQRQRLDQKRAQADQVIVTHLVGDESETEGIRLWVVSVRNRSEHPIYHVRLIVSRSKSWKRMLRKTNPPLHLAESGHEDELCEAIVPDFVCIAYLSTYEAENSTIEPGVERFAQLDTRADEDYYDVLLTMRDASNRTWHVDVSHGRQRRYVSAKQAKRRLDSVTEIIKVVRAKKADDPIVEVSQPGAVSLRDDRARLQLEEQMASFGKWSLVPKLKFTNPQGYM